jgi:hypothetical protein
MRGVNVSAPIAATEAAAKRSLCGATRTHIQDAIDHHPPLRREARMAEKAGRGLADAAA